MVSDITVAESAVFLSFFAVLLWRSEVAQSCPTFCDLMDYSLPGSSIHGIFQARILECIAFFLWRALQVCLLFFFLNQLDG